MFQVLKSNIESLLKKSNLIVNCVRYTANSQPADYIRTNLHNGVGRYVCQMSRVTFKFCKEDPASRGIRYVDKLTN